MKKVNVIFFLFPRAERAFGTATVQVHVGKIEDAEHVAAAAEAGLPEDVVYRESLQVRVHHSLVALNVAHGLGQQGYCRQHIAGLRLGEELVGGIDLVAQRDVPDVVYAAERFHPLALVLVLLSTGNIHHVSYFDHKEYDFRNKSTKFQRD